MKLNSSTQLMNLGINLGVYHYVRASRLSLRELQDSLDNPHSPIRPMYATLLKLNTCGRAFSTIFNLITLRIAALQAKETKLKEELAQHPQLQTALREQYENAFSQITTAKKRLRACEQRYRLLQQVFLKLQNKFDAQVQSLAGEFDEDRILIKQAFLDGGMSRFDEKNVEDTLNYMLNLTKDTYNVR